MLPESPSKQNQRKEYYTNIDTFTSIFVPYASNIEDIRVFNIVCSSIIIIKNVSTVFYYFYVMKLFAHQTIIYLVSLFSWLSNGFFSLQFILNLEFTWNIN